MNYPFLASCDEALYNHLSEELAQQADEIVRPISHFFDAQGLPCPMPLLKAKVSLRLVASGQSLYLLASDQNSQTDIIAFCKKNGLMAHSWVSQWTDKPCYHFIINKP
ncbi:sulfurtransferase TusA family protein [Moraxella nasicaprae]|uniref:Sulfurtransferase TusA family protein n=1 Tax=Moraxella nasicaprae TaxID=2904122 RepID=A0ABY6F5Q2_9GAMM|nr:sulfurtransferase TusA family protein [Moraxella nasicaprae]UXZ05436.1 sulfurtransferase TusA family protein [Moraxella nasicaprae]